MIRERGVTVVQCGTQLPGNAGLVAHSRHMESLELCPVTSATSHRGAHFDGVQSHEADANLALHTGRKMLIPVALTQPPHTSF